MRTVATLVCLMLAAAAVLPAQEAAPAAGPGTYRLSFVIHETADGKPASTHNYTMLLDDGASGSIRTSAKIPISTGGVSFTYQDVGLSLNCNLHSRDSQVLLKTTLSFSQVAPGQAQQTEIRQNSTETTALVLPGKPAVILSFDDWSSKRRYDVEVTAVRVK